MKKKGISPLIAAVLLIVFTVAISTLVVNWLRTYTTDMTDTVDTTSENVLDCAKQNLEITNVYLGVDASNPETIKATLKNTGQIEFTLTSAYAYNTSGDFCSLNTVTVPVGGVANIQNSSCEFLIDSDGFSHLEVTTDCGVSEVFDTADSPTLM
ncbi:MAG: archaellin/type IV pilin N-terminal domain-containing protein [archaeon]|nr:archaellin/type IV pilin N-terminal domain-containing protein [archaeon]